MSTIKITVNLLCGVRVEDDLWVSVCPRLKVYSQGTSEEEAIEAIRSAITLHLATAYDHNRLDKVLRRAGFDRIENSVLDERSPGERNSMLDGCEEYVSIEANEFKQVDVEVPLSLLASKFSLGHGSPCSSIA